MSNIIKSYGIALQAIDRDIKLAGVSVDGTGRALDDTAVVTSLEWRPGGKRRVRKQIGILTPRGYRSMQEVAQ